MNNLFSFPDPVNETSSRIVAAGVVVQSIAFLVIREGWVLIPLTYGFSARVATGPTLSPLGQFATRVVTPRVQIDHRFVPGAPKRFAQGVGVVFTGGASIAWALGAPIVAYALIGGLVIAASLEAFAAVCLGCIVYNRVWGCADCDDLTGRLPADVPSAT